MVSHTISVEKQLASRKEINEHLNRASAMIYMASIASTYEPLYVKMMQDYFCIMHKVMLEAIKVNEDELDVLLGQYVSSEKDTTNAKEELKAENTVKFNAIEMECIQQLFEGKSLSEVGIKLNIAKNTADFHVVNGIRKLISLTSMKFN